MDELLSEFLAETSDQLECVETQLVQFEQDPSNAALIGSIFRLVHTIKGTASFLDLNRLQAVAHAAENLLGELRDGASPTADAVSTILSTIDRIKELLRAIEAEGAEPAGDDSELISALQAHSAATSADKPQSRKTGKSTSRRQAGKGSGTKGRNQANTAKRNARGKSSASQEDANGAEAEEIQTDCGSGQDNEHHAAPGKQESQAGHGGEEAPAEQSTPSPAGKSSGNGRTVQRNGETIRVAVDTIERIMQIVSELVLNRNQLLELTRHLDNDPVKPPLQRLSGLTTDLQDAVMRARMQPVERLFSGLPRLVRELSKDLNKKINLETDGADTELDRQLIEVLRDPLTHIIRNCVDHGIETAEERTAAGKPSAGEIRISASHEAGQITIEIADDGRGLDLESIKQRAVARGLGTADQIARLSNEEICRFIFAAGFSTAAHVTSVSGRGVGMDVVRSNIESVGGSVTLSTVPGQGSRFSLKIPLTLAIAPALIVQAGQQRFALPQTAVVEAVGLGADSRYALERIQGGLILRLRDEVIPVVDLSSILAYGADSEDQSSRNADEDLVIVIRVGAEIFGLRVDTVLDVQEIVVKPLNASLAHLRLFTGQTILGDGSVVLILDPSGIAAQLGIEKSREKKAEPAGDNTSQANRTLLILFRAGDGMTKALPLSVLARIEMVDVDRLQRSDGRFVMLHQGKLTPVLPTSPDQPVSDKPHPVLILSVKAHRIGLLVDEIIDVVEEPLSIELPSLTDDMVGTTEIRGLPVELIDVSYYLHAAYSSLYSQKAHKLLLAESDPLFADTLKPALVSAGYHVTVATSSAEVLELLETDEAFDAVLIDGGLKADKDSALGPYLRNTLVSPDLPIFQLFEQPTSDTRHLPTDDPNTVNLSKLDRQQLLSALATILPHRKSGGPSEGLAA